jgi:YD repeat-containing protein
VLTQVTQGGATTESYTYDYVGNRLTSLGVPNYSYNSSNELTSSSEASYGYDANGSTVTKNDPSGITTYSWDFENRLTSVALPGSGATATDANNRTTSHAYDDADRLTRNWAQRPSPRRSTSSTRFFSMTAFSISLSRLRSATSFFSR